MRSYTDKEAPLPGHEALAAEARARLAEHYRNSEVRVSYAFWEPDETIKMHFADGHTEDTGKPFSERYVTVEDDTAVREYCGHPVDDGMICTLGVVIV